MKTQAFQKLLLHTAVVCMGVDGEIHQREVAALRSVIKHSAYFLDFVYEEVLQANIDILKKEGKREVENYLLHLRNCELEEKQKIILLEVLLKIIDADEQVHQNELYLLRQIRKALEIGESELILHFPKHLSYILDFDTQFRELDLTTIIESSVS